MCVCLHVLTFLTSVHMFTCTYIEDVCVYVYLYLQWRRVCVCLHVLILKMSRSQVFVSLCAFTLNTIWFLLTCNCIEDIYMHFHWKWRYVCWVLLLYSQSQLPMSQSFWTLNIRWLYTVSWLIATIKSKSIIIYLLNLK